MDDKRNITLNLPKSLIRKAKRLAAERETSMSALMAEALRRLASEDREYAQARRRALTALQSAGSLGTEGRRTWSRDSLHER